MQLANKFNFGQQHLPPDFLDDLNLNKIEHCFLIYTEFPSLTLQTKGLFYFQQHLELISPHHKRNMVLNPFRVVKPALNMEYHTEMYISLLASHTDQLSFLVLTLFLLLDHGLPHSAASKLLVNYSAPADQPSSTGYAHTRTDSPRPPARSGPASGTAPSPYHSNGTGCSATPILHPHTVPQNAGYSSASRFMQ